MYFIKSMDSFSGYADFFGIPFTIFYIWFTYYSSNIHNLYPLNILYSMDIEPYIVAWEYKRKFMIEIWNILFPLYVYSTFLYFSTNIFRFCHIWCLKASEWKFLVWRLHHAFIHNIFIAIHCDIWLSHTHDTLKRFGYI